MKQKTAHLVLADGTVFTGKSFGASVEKLGEVVFNTAMTGYQEILSDPSNCGQIITMTYPLIGNYGINREDFESLIPVIHGVVVKEHSTYPSNWRKERTLDEYLKEYGIPGIYDLDTRQLTRHLRDHGTMKGMIVLEETPDVEAIKQRLQEEQTEQNLVAEVSTKSPYHIPGSGFRVAVLDLGIKASLIRELTRRECDLLVFPYHTSSEEILRWQPDGVLVSNGPGSPYDLPEVITCVQQLLGKVPLLGIALGHQLLAVSCGAEVVKLPSGHRGANFPVKELNSGKISLTVQNHGYTVLAESVVNTPLEITHVNINDHSVEGLRHKEYAAFSVQFQPEAMRSFAGDLVFEQFFQSMDKMARKGERYAAQ